MAKSYRTRSIIQMLGAAILLMSAATSCRKDAEAPAGGEQPAAAEQALKVAMVLPGNITDKSWNQSGYEGLLRAEEELQLEVAFSEQVPQPDQVEAMADYARRGFDVVIGHGGEFQGTAEEVAERFPDTLFVVDNGTTPGKNLATVDFYYKQFGYLLGYLGARMSKTGKGGFIGAQQIKFSIDLAAGFEEGFKAANPDGEVLVAWTNDWDDVAKAKEAALNQISEGVDVIFPTMDNAIIGSLQAAKEKNVWAFGIYYDAVADWPDTVLQSAILDIRAGLTSFLSLAKENKAEGKNYKFGVESPAVARLGTYHQAIPQEVRDEVEGLREDMVAGRLQP